MMLAPETTTDECHDCRTCVACMGSIHSCCYPVVCTTTGLRHDCNCVVCQPRRLP